MNRSTGPRPLLFLFTLIVMWHVKQFMDKTTHIEFMQEIEDRGHADGCNVLTTSFLRRTKETCTCDRVDTYQAEFDQYAEFRK